MKETSLSFFKISFIFLIALFLFSRPASAATYITPGNSSASATWTPSQSPYVIDGNVYYRDGNLAIEPGTIVKFTQSSSLTIHADVDFYANGTTDMPIYFTSIKDDSVGGDTNENGNASLPFYGDWGYVSVGGGSFNRGLNINHIKIRYGGNIVWNNGAYPAMILHFNWYYGFPNQNYWLENIEVSNSKTGLYAYVAGKHTFNVSQSSFHDNQDYGMYADIPYLGTADAKNNWWGDASGPYHPASNSLGAGDAVSDDVNFIPWLTSDPLPPIAQKEVPLYTQVRSPYPSDDETKIWADLEYAEGFTKTYICGSKIYQCGCAITSIVMIARYYDITEAQGQDINPATINEWLRDNNGYQNGDVNWIAGARYTDWRITYAKTDKTANNYAFLDEYLNENQPVIAKANAGRGGINRQHFFVIDNILASTYGVKDPAWYNTKTLNETTDTSKHIRGYENGFDGLRIYKKGDGIAQSAITIVLGSPAELLITDPLGRKLGKDASGIEYGEIPNAWYFEDGIDDPTGENPSVQERNKIIQILKPVDGEYKLEVFGTGQGDYSLDANFYDIQGNVNNKLFQSETAVGYTAQYNISFNSSDSTNNIIESIDEIPPEAKIYFNSIAQQLEIEGIDNTTVNPVISVVENIDEQTIYQIQDEVGNAAKLIFEKTEQHGKKIKAELKSVQYNDGEIINLPKTDLKYEWSLDKDGVIKELEQKIKVKNQFEIHAKYNHKKDETEIKIKLPNQEKQRQIFPGIKIIKLITESGNLDFGYVE